MSADPTATKPAAARVAAGSARDAARSLAAVQELSLADTDRIDERTRLAVLALFHGIVRTIERGLVETMARASPPPSRERHEQTSKGVSSRTLITAALRDRALVDELLGRVRQERLADALPRAPTDGDRPSLLARLLSCPDTAVAGAARALLIADNRRRGVPVGSELPADLDRRLVWLVAATLHLRDDDVATEVLTAAAEQCVFAHDDGTRAEVAAMRLVASIDASPAELPGLLTDALGDGRAVVFIAALAHAGGISYETARAVVLDPAGERLWLLLRAQNLERETIATIAFALAEADPARDIDTFADALDGIMAVPPEEARAALAPYRRDRRLSDALRTLAEG